MHGQTKNSNFCIIFVAHVSIKRLCIANKNLSCSLLNDIELNYDPTSPYLNRKCQKRPAILSNSLPNPGERMSLDVSLAKYSDFDHRSLK